MAFPVAFQVHAEVSLPGAVIFLFLPSIFHSVPCIHPEKSGLSHYSPDSPSSIWLYTVLTR